MPSGTIIMPYGTIIMPYGAIWPEFLPKLARFAPGSAPPGAAPRRQGVAREGHASRICIPLGVIAVSAPARWRPPACGDPGGFSTPNGIKIRALMR